MTNILLWGEVRFYKKCNKTCFFKVLFSIWVKKLCKKATVIQ